MFPSLPGATHRVIRWLLDNKNQLKEMLQAAIAGFKRALDGDEAGVQEQVEKTLGRAIGPLVSGLFAIVGAGNVVAKVKGFARGAIGKALQPVVSLLKPLGQTIEKTLSAGAPRVAKDAKGVRKAGRIKPLLPGKPIGKTGAKLWLDEDGQLWVSASDAKPLEQKLDCVPEEKRRQLKSLVKRVKADYNQAGESVRCNHAPIH